jgi:SAM-dependent methyltransferase
LNEIEGSPWGKKQCTTPASRARWFHYNIYSIPWRSFEIMDVLSKQTRSDLAGLRVLDLACGLATMGLYFALDGRADLVVGVDRDISVLHLICRVLSESGIDNLRVVRGDLANPPVRKEKFDCILSYDSFYYPGISKDQAAQQAFETLKSGGTLLIKVVNRLFPVYGLAALPGVRRIVSSTLNSDRIGGRSYGIAQPAAPTSIGLVRLLRRKGFTRVNVYNRFTRQPSGWTRWFLPDVIVAASRP